jgi:hypothetical protein
MDMSGRCNICGAAIPIDRSRQYCDKHLEIVLETQAEMMAKIREAHEYMETCGEVNINIRRK